jgi:hypothetical protein
MSDGPAPQARPPEAEPVRDAPPVANPAQDMAVIRDRNQPDLGALNSSAARPVEHEPRNEAAPAHGPATSKEQPQSSPEATGGRPKAPADSAPPPDTDRSEARDNSRANAVAHDTNENRVRSVTSDSGRDRTPISERTSSNLESHRSANDKQQSGTPTKGTDSGRLPIESPPAGRRLAQAAAQSRIMTSDDDEGPDGNEGPRATGELSARMRDWIDRAPQDRAGTVPEIFENSRESLGPERRRLNKLGETRRSRPSTDKPARHDRPDKPQSRDRDKPGEQRKPRQSDALPNAEKGPARKEADSTAEPQPLRRGERTARSGEEPHRESISAQGTDRAETLDRLSERYQSILSDPEVAALVPLVNQTLRGITGAELRPSVGDLQLWLKLFDGYVDAVRQEASVYINHVSAGLENARDQLRNREQGHLWAIADRLGGADAPDKSEFAGVEGMLAEVRRDLERGNLSSAAYNLQSTMSAWNSLSDRTSEYFKARHSGTGTLNTTVQTSKEIAKEFLMSVGTGGTATWVRVLVNAGRIIAAADNAEQAATAIRNAQTPEEAERIALELAATTAKSGMDAGKTMSARRGMGSRFSETAVEGLPGGRSPNIDAWEAEYRRSTLGDREIVHVTTNNGITYLYDSTPVRSGQEAENRAVALWGRSAPPLGERDKKRMSGYPSPAGKSSEPLDRGHFLARIAGGGEDLNLFPQLRLLNQGRSAEGKLWRHMEKYLAANPGTDFFVRPIYSDITDFPVQVEFGIRFRDGIWRTHTFANR